MTESKSSDDPPTERMTKAVWLAPLRVQRLKVIAARRGVSVGALVEEYIGARSDAEYREAVREEAERFDLGEAGA